ncbi:uncharacterized protein [Taeniopygia guttata]|uniref:uncharacterized protein isoform X1 n=1 Tax=Taeniopygia guttata TaxID=59729 RepID=UPI0011AEF95F|nr:translation initiation factor IF-2-like isoform X2 [Taeniopygia guttata]
MERESAREPGPLSRRRAAQVAPPRQGEASGDTERSRAAPARWRKPEPAASAAPRRWRRPRRSTAREPLGRGRRRGLGLAFPWARRSPRAGIAASLGQRGRPSGGCGAVRGAAERDAARRAGGALAMSWPVPPPAGSCSASGSCWTERPTPTPPTPTAGPPSRDSFPLLNELLGALGEAQLRKRRGRTCWYCPGHAGDDAGQPAGGRAAAAARSRPQPPRPAHRLPPGARRGPLRLSGDAGGAAPGRGAPRPPRRPRPPAPRRGGGGPARSGEAVPAR